MKFRKIEIDDNQNVEKLIRDTMKEFSCVGPGYSIEDTEVRDMFGHYQEDTSIFYVIEDDEGTILGCGGIAQLAGGSSEECELKKMYFSSKLRGMGYGSKLIQKLLDFAKMHYTTVYLETMQNMSSARKLYEKSGFSYLESGMGHTGHFNCDTYMALKFL